MSNGLSSAGGSFNSLLNVLSRLIGDKSSSLNCPKEKQITWYNKYRISQDFIIYTVYAIFIIRKV